MSSRQKPTRSKSSKPSARPGKSDRESSSEKPEKRGFVFRDRSGKVHGTPAKAGAGFGGPSVGPFEGHGDDSSSHRFKSDSPLTKKIVKPGSKSAVALPDSPALKDSYKSTVGGRPKAEPAASSELLAERPAKGGANTLRAVVDKNRKGFAFLIFDSKQVEDAFVPPHEADSLFHGDRVEVTMGRGGRVQGIHVLSHRFRELVGRYQPIPAGRGKGATVIYERKRAREEVYCPNPHPTAKAGEWVRCRLNFDPGSGQAIGEVVAVYGEVLPPSADVEMVAAEYNLIEHHSDRANEEAKAYKLDASDPHRVDLKSVPFITIDGETARDFDDAIFVEKNSEGFLLWVAIADVSHYVTLGTTLDEEARARGTSVYFPERAFHMLPRALSENLCSLRPNELRLTMVAKMQFDTSGNRKSTEVMEAVIESRRRATYNEIQAEWEKNQTNPSWEYTAHFALYQLIRKQRSQRGSIDFDLPEAELKVKPTGEVESIKIRARIDAHRLIEEFMVAANEAVTDWMLERHWPFVYRTHEEPSEQALERFQKLAETVGVEVRLQSGPIHQQLARILETLQGHPAQTLLNTAMLRSMKQAVYSAVHGPHFGLASEGYTHFTSPIRRYPDLVVHRLLRWALNVERGQKQKLGREEREKLDRELDEICEHCSYRERLASDAERESIKLKQVRAVMGREGEEFDGKVNGIVETGFFVQTADPYVEGMVSRDVLDDDSYEFDEERMAFFGRRTRRAFRIGDEVKIKILKSDIDTRTIDFGLVSHTPRQHTNADTEFLAGRKAKGRDERGGFSKSGRDKRDDRGKRGSRDRGGRDERPGRDDRGGGKRGFGGKRDERPSSEPGRTIQPLRDDERRPPSARPGQRPDKRGGKRDERGGAPGGGRQEFGAGYGKKRFEDGFHSGESRAKRKEKRSEKRGPQAFTGRALEERAGAAGTPKPKKKHRGKR